MKLHQWKVIYEDLRDKKARMPFWKRTSYVQAESRIDAIRQMQARFASPAYGNFRASKVQAESGAMVEGGAI